MNNQWKQTDIILFYGNRTHIFSSNGKICEDGNKNHKKCFIDVTPVDKKQTFSVYECAAF